MAQRVLITLHDDIDGDTADETVHFGLDGVSYEIDLSAAHGTALREALLPYIRAGRKTNGTTRSTATPKPSTAIGKDAGKIRAWAAGVGIDSISERGRVPSAVVAAYLARGTGDGEDLLKKARQGYSSVIHGQTTITEIPEQHTTPEIGDEFLSKEPTDIPAEDMDFPEAADRKRWLSRTSGPDKVENLTTEQRLALLTPKHYTVLHSIATGTPSTGVKGFKTFEAKLRNLGFIGFDDRITRAGLAALNAYLATSASA